MSPAGPPWFVSGLICCCLRRCLGAAVLRAELARVFCASGAGRIPLWGTPRAGAEDAVCRAVDFGAGWFDLNYAFGQQRSMNPPGQSPPICAEF